MGSSRCGATGGFTLVNTVMGLVVDAETRRPVLGGGGGGLSGPAIKLRSRCAVHEVARVPDVPIIGTGGASNGVDAVEMLLAGATRWVAVGTASFLDPRAPQKIVHEIRTWCASPRRGVADLTGALEAAP